MSRILLRQSYDLRFDRELYAARHYPHSFSDRVAAANAGGLAIAEVREPTIDFEHNWRVCPALLVIRETKAG